MSTLISRRRFAGLTLSGGVAVLLAACSSTPPASSSTGSASATQAPAAAPTKAAASQSSGSSAKATAAPAQSANAKPAGEIHYLCRPDIVTAYGAQAAVKGFMDAHPGTKLSLEKPPQETAPQLLTKIRAAIASNSLVWDGYSVMVAPWDTAQWVKAQVIQPLDSLISGSTEKDATKLVPGIIPTIKEASSYEGKLYAIPGNVGSVVLQWYWEPLKGIGLTKQPATWDDTYAAAAKIKAKYPKWIPFAQDSEPLTGLITLMFAATPPKELFVNGLLNLKAQGAIDAMNFLKKMVKAGFMPATDQNVVDDWNRKTVAMLMSYDVMGEDAQKTYGYSAADTGVNIYPKAGEINSGTPFWMNSSVVLNKAKNPQGMMDFYIWWFGPSNSAAQQTLVATAAKPCYSYTYDQFVKGNDKFAWQQTGIDLVSKSAPFPTNTDFYIQSDAIKPWEDKFLANGSTLTAEQALVGAAKDVADKISAQNG